MALVSYLYINVVSFLLALFFVFFLYFFVNTRRVDVYIPISDVLIIFQAPPPPLAARPGPSHTQNTCNRSASPSVSPVDSSPHTFVSPAHPRGGVGLL